MAESTNGIERIAPGALAAALQRREPLAILDVRRREAWTADATRIPGAIWLPLEEVPRRVQELAREVHLVVYCS